MPEKLAVSFCFIDTIIISSQINWRPVLGGFTLQFYFATMILKWDKGYQVVSAIGQGFVEFLNFTNYGSTFVFGNTDDHFLVFKVRRKLDLAH